MKRIAIIDNGVLPIPSVLGGAVETLVQLLVDTNEKEKQMLFEIFLSIMLMQGKRQKNIDIPIFTLLVLQAF